METSVDHISSDPLLHPPSHPENGPLKVAKPERPIFFTILSLYFWLNFTWYFLEVPTVRLLEYAVCQQYYRSHPQGIGMLHEEVGERFCKVEAIQAKVATLTGGKISLDAMSGLLTALFYSFIADKYGRKLVLILGFTGELLALIWIVCICYFNRIVPTMLVWLSALILVVGGGQPVISSILFTMLTDIIEPLQKIQFLYIMHAMSLLSGVLAPPLAALSMNYSLWLPFALALMLCTTQLGVALVARETKTISPVFGESNSSSNLREGNEEEDFPLSSSETQERHYLSLEFKSAKEKVYKVLSTQQVIVCLLIFPLKRAGFQSQPFIYQYASERFGLELRHTAWFRSALSGSSVLVVGILLPILTICLRKTDLRDNSIDLGVLRGSVLLLAITFLGIWAAFKATFFSLAVVLCGLGEGLEPALQGYSCSLIDKTENSQLFTAVASMETLARIVAASTMGKLYSVKRDRSGKPTGLPFLVSAGLFASGVLLSCFLVATQ